MTEGKGVPTSEQEQGPDKRPPWWKRLLARTGFGDKTLWDMLQLLIVPLALALIGLWFTGQQDARQQRIENQRAEAERELAEQRAQDEALQAYLDQMGSLLLEKDLRTSEEDSEVRILARARTATMIQRLDSDRNRNVIRFLQEAGLISKEQSSIRLLAGADLRGAHLEGANLSEADLSEADLSRAYLSRADLRGADLNHADLRRADLSDFAVLILADLSEANLFRADLSGAYLHDADLSGAYLHDADLSRAYLHDADLRRADLRRANLRGATRLTDEKIAAAEYLEGATMPNGQKYEVWLKDKEGQRGPRRGQGEYPTLLQSQNELPRTPIPRTPVNKGKH